MDDNNQDSELDRVKAFWKDVHIVGIPPDDSLKSVFDSLFNDLGKRFFKNPFGFFRSRH